MAKPWPSVSFFAPVYDDAGTIGRVVAKASRLFTKHCPDHEIWLINDASPDNAAEVLAGLQKLYPNVHVLTHGKNMGYGLTIRDGLSHAAKHEWVAFCDGDDQFDITDLERLAPVLQEDERIGAVITRRTTFPNGPWRTFLSRRYNQWVRGLFKTPYGDISCSLKLFRRSALEGLTFKSESPFIDAEIVLRIAHAGHLVREVGIPSYPRTSGKSHSLRPANIVKLYGEMMELRGELGAD